MFGAEGGTQVCWMEVWSFSQVELAALRVWGAPGASAPPTSALVLRSVAASMCAVLCACRDQIHKELNCKPFLWFWLFVQREEPGAAVLQL